MILKDGEIEIRLFGVASGLLLKSKLVGITHLGRSFAGEFCSISMYWRIFGYRFRTMFGEYKVPYHIKRYQFIHSVLENCSLSVVRSWRVSYYSSSRS
jgi:hypothetical protein